MERGKVPGKLIYLNKEIEAAGKRKNLGEALGHFAEIERLGYQPSVISYTSLINACVRCDDVTRALKVFDMMKTKRVEPNVVTYTAILKGVCSTNNIEDLDRAKAILDEMRSKNVVSNFRTFNTVLRGCQRIGALKMTTSVFEQYLEEAAVGEFSVIGAVVQMYCQAMELDKARDAIHTWNEVVALHSQQRMTSAEAAARSIEEKEEIKEDLSHLSKEEKKKLKKAQKKIEKRKRKAEENGKETITPLPCRLSLATAHALLGNILNCRRQVRRVLRLIDSNESASNLFLGDLGADAIQGTEAKTPALFIRLKKKEYKRRAEVLNKFAQKALMGVDEEVASEEQVNKHLDKFQQKHIERVASQLCRTTYIPPRRAAAIGKTNKKLELLSEAMKSLDSLGFAAIIKQAADMGIKFSSKKKRVEDEDSYKRDSAVEAWVKDQFGNDESEKYISTARDLALRYASKFSSLENHDFRMNRLEVTKLFAAPRVAYKLEVCSGLGDWVCSTAKSDPESGWIAMELRHDRCWLTTTNAIMEDVENVAVVGGDAKAILEDGLIAESLLDEVWINFPEPPASADDHLLSVGLLRLLHHATCHGGLIRVVTDSGHYCRIMASEFQTLIKEGLAEIVDRKFAVEMRKGSSILSDEELKMGPVSDKENKESSASSSSSSSSSEESSSDSDSDSDSDSSSTDENNMDVEDEQKKIETQHLTTNPLMRRDIWHDGMPEGFATSFFDRLWENGDKNKRYTIAVRVLKNNEN